MDLGGRTATGLLSTFLVLGGLCPPGPPVARFLSGPFPRGLFPLGPLAADHGNDDVGRVVDFVPRWFRVPARGAASSAPAPAGSPSPSARARARRRRRRRPRPSRPRRPRGRARSRAPRRRCPRTRRWPCSRGAARPPLRRAPGTASSRCFEPVAQRADALGLARPAPRARATRAAPKPTMPATFSVPARRLRSWAPPRTSGASGVPRRTYRQPTPFGPYSLCAESVSRSTSSARTSSGILPPACTASQWTSAPRSCASRAASGTGWSTPVSLLASITETTVAESASFARRSSRSSRPSSSDARDLDRCALLGEGLGAVEHRVVLDGAHDDAARPARLRARHRAAPCCPTRCRSP